MSELKLSGDFGAEVWVGDEWRQTEVSHDIVVSSYWEEDVPLTLHFAPPPGVGSANKDTPVGTISGLSVAITGLEEIDALRRYCEMVIEHYKTDRAKLKL